VYETLAQYYSRIFPLNPALPIFIKEEMGKRRTLLDLGCGTGELDNALLEQGYDCLGIDSDESMVRNAGGKGFPDHFRKMNIEDIKTLKGRWGLVISTGNVMSHLAMGALKQTVQDVYEILEPGGKWIFQIINWNRFFRQGYDFPVLERENGILKFYRKYTGNDEKVNFTVRLEEKGREVYEGTSTLFPMAIEEHTKINEAAGFLCRAKYKNWKREPFTPDKDDSVIFLMEKP
jgi:2-polyprenyl-3-methyl-5-hydroxy-6-metoxy-1,4-benzoquinol methylase